MEITEVRVKLITAKNDKLRAFCSITIDNDFVIRDLKVIEGAKGPFVAMPSRKVMERCKKCGEKNHHRANFCNECGGRLSPSKNGRSRGAKLHADIAHPINSSCREMVQRRVLEYYSDEVEKSTQPGYRPQDYDDFDDDLLPAEPAAAGKRELPFDREEPSTTGKETPRPYDFERISARSTDRPGAGDVGVKVDVDVDGNARDDVPERARPTPEPPERERERFREPRPRPPERRFPDELETEPEDNFGAGLFS